MRYTDEQIEGLLRGVFNGTYTNKKLPRDLYFAIADYLKRGVYQGFGETIDTAVGRDLALLQELRENIYMFSAAKTYQEVVTMRNLLVDSPAWKDFKNSALEIYSQYNKTWLRTEYDTAIGQAQSAYAWSQFEKNKDVLPNLRYSTIGDACDICGPLNGLTAPVDSPLWATVAPLNHFNCMCILEATDDDVSIKDISEVEEKMSDLFKMNPGKDGYVFKDSHPYFEVAPGDRGLAALNFNLPIPESD